MSTEFFANSMLLNSKSIFERSVKKSRGFNAKHRRHQLKAFLNLSNLNERNRPRCEVNEESKKESTHKLTSSTPSLSICFNRRKRPSSAISNHIPPILGVGHDSMATILSYLEPTEILSFIIMPLSKNWRSTYTRCNDLWKILCLTEPFNAKYEDISVENTNFLLEDEFGDEIGRYRLVYSSFVQCHKYLECIKAESQKVSKPSSIPTIPPPFGLTFQKSNASLGSYLVQAQSVVLNISSNQDKDEGEPNVKNVNYNPFGVTDDGRFSENHPNKKLKKDSISLQIGHSLLTERLLKRPEFGNGIGYVNLPWSCSIYSVVNWMISFADVIGIQIMCLKALPFLLEDDSQRTTALSAGLVDIVLTHMVHFPSSAELHTAALHALVLLARPVGGKEGLMLHGPIDSIKTFFSVTSSGKNGIDIMLDSMNRFLCDEMLQAMGCWSMVNISLKQSQKTSLIVSGGISTALNAMRAHPNNPEVQFRALFALINLAISPTTLSDSQDAQRISKVKEIMDSKVDEIITMILKAMNNFKSNSAILNRSCLILHNLSLNPAYHPNILFAPNCYQLLKICVANHDEDKILLQGAGGALRRLHSTLSSNVSLRARFIAFTNPRQQRISAAPLIVNTL